MARMGPARVKCPHCAAPLELPIRIVPAPDTDDRTANFTIHVSTEPVERHLRWCPASPDGPVPAAG
jgi:hypothetical protein